MVDAVRADGVEAGVGAVARGHGDREQKPADRVPRLPARDERADGRERDHQQQLPDPAERELVREGRQREARDDQQRRRGTEPQGDAPRHVRVHTVTCAGSRECAAAAASSPRTVSTSTAPRNRAENAATVASAS